MVLLIYAHPTKNGHNGLLFKEIKAQLSGNIEIIDLYEKGYKPVLQKQELYTSGKKTVAKETKKYQNLIKKHRHIIIVAPVWWNGVPAILKGFFDRTLTSGFAYTYVKLPFSFLGVAARPVPLLQGKKAVVFLTTGAPRFLGWLINKRRAHNVVVKDTLGFCGIKAKYFTLPNCTGDPVERKNDSVKLVQKGLRYLL